MTSLSLGGTPAIWCFFILVTWRRWTTASILSRSISDCFMFFIHVPCVCHFPFPARRSLLFSLRLLGESANCVWNFRGVCHCRDVARGSDRMISLCTSWALLSLSIVALMVYLPVEISTQFYLSTSTTLFPTMLLGSYFLLNPLLLTQI